VEGTVTSIVLVALALAVRAQAPSAPGFSLTFDGGVFHATTVALKPLGATYANTYWRATRDPRVNRLSLTADVSNGLSIHFDAAPRLGVTSYDRRDEDDPNRNPYMRFDLYAGDWPPAQGYRFDLQHVDVTITRLDPPGGRIEGTFDGRYELCTLPGDGGGNCTARAPLRLSGRFSVVRIKDRVID
jgi:hypothetical protein